MSVIDWNKLEGFEWDVGNERKSVTKHSVTNLESEEIFFNKPLVVSVDSKHSIYESRHYALGQTHQGRLLFVSFTIRKKKFVRVISARDMSKKERRQYEEA